MTSTFPISRHYVLAAGGTGGHMMPAYALASELIQRGHRVAIVTDARGEKIPGMPDEAQLHILPAGRVGGGVKSWLTAARDIWKGRAMGRELLRNFQPSCVIGFGGYPALPTLLAAFAEGVPTVVHEQNAVLGRVNRLVARRVDAIATGFSSVQRLAERYRSKVHPTGNPVRAEVIALRDEPFPPLDEEGIFRVLVTGGSQGATVLSDVVPEGLGMLPINLRRRLQVTQQCRAEDIEAVRAKYVELDIPAELATYMTDIPERMGWSHLVIARAGASTLAEIACIGRPAILIPLPSAMDDHQTHNVADLVASGGARAIAQSRFTPKELAKQIQKMALLPDTLAAAAKGAWNCGRPRAVEDLADLVEGFGAAPIVEPMKAGGASSGMPSASPAFANEVAQ